MVGAGLRPANQALCITEDMCAPIFPNADHPTGRAPLVPKIPFPFPNCYHWFGEDTELEVRIKRGVYDQQDGEQHVALPGIQHAYMQDYYQDDNYRVLDMRAQQAGTDGQATSVYAESECSVYQDPEGIDRGEIDNSSDFNCSFGDCSVEGSFASDACSDQEPTDIFGMNRDSRRAMIPVVDCWLDLRAHLKEDEIPNPFTFIRQCRALSQYVSFLSLLMCASHCFWVESCKTCSYEKHSDLL